MSNEAKVFYRQISSSGSEGKARHHVIVSDRPEEKGGNDSGPMGGELFLLGLGGCFMANLLAAINSRNAQVSAVELEVTGQLEGTPTRFSRAELKVSAQYSDESEMKKLITIAERGCIVANTIKGAVAVDIILS